MNAEYPVSVIIPCYNGAKYLSRAVASVMNQEVPETQIIIVDDCSTDGSLKVAQGLVERYPGVRSIQQPVNGGPASARNAGLRQATGRYVCFLDADDEYAPGFFKTVLPFLEEDKELCWVVTGIELVNSHREVHPVQLDAMVNSMPSNLIVRKTVADLIGGFPEDAAFRGQSAGEDIMFRSALRRWFKGLQLAERFLRYSVRRTGHFDQFLETTKVEGSQTVAATPLPEEERIALLAAQKRYRELVKERVAILGSFRSLDGTFPAVVDRLFRSVAEYDDVRATADSIEGFLHPQEGFALYHFAKQGPGRGAIVEIGSLFGRSTSWLAAGTRASRREKVVAVDHFRGSPEHKKGGSHSLPAIAQAGTSLPIFLANLEKRGFRNWVDVRVGSSADIGADWQGPIRLLFIDGDHSFEATRKDVEVWSKHVVIDGLMAFHDVDVWPGVTEVYKQLVRSSRWWQEVCQVRSLRVVRRVE